MGSVNLLFVCLFAQGYHPMSSPGSHDMMQPSASGLPPMSSFRGNGPAPGGSSSSYGSTSPPVNGSDMVPPQGHASGSSQSDALGKALASVSTDPCTGSLFESHMNMPQS